ncbi:MAG: VOC family protein [Deinococcales bacterium]
MQKIMPFLWFDTQAEEAINFYLPLFKDSSIQSISRYGDNMPLAKGTAMTVNFRLEGLDFIALNGGPQFKFNPSISFFVTLESETELDALWQGLSENATTLMPLQNYPWSAKYGWLNDKYGLSWQINLGKPKDSGGTIVPSLLFVGEQFGKAEEAMKLYMGLFGGSSLTHIMHNKNSVQHAQFKLAEQSFMAMDSNAQHNFAFNEAISFFVNCDDQAEVDHFWHALSAHPKAEQCGWLKDKYGISWQIIPKTLMELMGDPDRSKAARVTQAMLGMKKIDIAGLRQAYEQN